MAIETLAPAAPVETVTPLKPSEAMRLGRLRYPVEGIGCLIDATGATCALGAMLAGFDHDPDEIRSMGYTLVDRYIPGLVEQVYMLNDGVHPDHFNDEWSTERIAGWLEGQGL
jgi:hypothetical protein